MNGLLRYPKCLLMMILLLQAVASNEGLAKDSDSFLIDYNLPTLPLNLIEKTSSLGIVVGAALPVKGLWAIVDAEINDWEQTEGEETRYAKNGVSYSKSYDFRLFMAGARYYFSAPSKGSFVSSGLSYHAIDATIGVKQLTDTASLHTESTSVYFGGGYSFLENSKFDVTLSGRLLIGSFSGDNADAWPVFEQQPDTHLINDVIKNPVIKGDITIGYRI